MSAPPISGIARPGERVRAIDWAPREARELYTETLLSDTPAAWRVVACLNVWNDCAALEKTLPTWYNYVDNVIAVDGAYATTGAPPLSTDGTREYLQSLAKVQLLDVGHGTQFDKRNAYLNAARLGDLLFVIDADESVANPELLRQVPWLDVGWVRIRSALYKREYGQPRLFRAAPGLLEYRGRHHWVYAEDQLLATHQYGGTGFEHRPVALRIENQRGLGHTPARSRAKQAHAHAQFAVESPLIATRHSAASDAKVSKREPLRIVQAALLDAGLAPSRFHTAINRTTPHSSLFWKQEEGPFGARGQFSAITDRITLRAAIELADIVHFHVHHMHLHAVTSQKRGVVLHHHGTALRRRPAAALRDAKLRRALTLVSNLELLTYAPDAAFLPNPVPVARYRRLVSRTPWTKDRPFRVAHSPSKPELKGTILFQEACLRLRDRGYPIDPVIITGMSHADALAIKATCDAAFDSFWLGMQCSGIEAAAMQMPVLAGDEIVAQRYTERFGAVPYTFVGSGDQLESALARLMDDPAFYHAEQDRVSAHILEYHDESAVALRYLDLLDERFKWRDWA